MAKSKKRKKKYVWLKLQEGFFRDKRMKKLRGIAGGDTYTIIYLKMQLLSVRNKGILVYDGVFDSFAEEIAEEINEKIENVQVTLNFLQTYKLIEELDDNQYLLPEAAMNIGSESESAERVRRFRERKEQEQLQKSEEIKALPGPADDALHCNDDVTKCNDYIETETEQNTETDSEIDSKTNIHTDIDVTELNARQKERIDFLRELFVEWNFNDYQIFHLSSLVNKRLPYDLSTSLDQQDLRIYDVLQEIVYLAKATPNIKYPFNWFCGVIEKYKGLE